jgi:hypothetical protein
MVSGKLRFCIAGFTFVARGGNWATQKRNSKCLKMKESRKGDPKKRNCLTFFAGERGM